MLKFLKKNDVAWLLVDLAFDWSLKPGNFMTFTEICHAAGFTPTNGDAVSVSKFLGRKKMQRFKVRGQRGAIMPALRVAKSEPAV